jgi:hypothetical protein
MLERNLEELIDVCVDPKSEADSFIHPKDAHVQETLFRLLIFLSSSSRKHF